MPLVEQTQLHNYEELKEYISGFRHIFIVCGDSSFKHCASGILEVLKSCNISYERFGEFDPNPTTVQVEAAIQSFNRASYDAILAIGGGSALDVAKCVKLYAGDTRSDDWPVRISNIPECEPVPFIAVPTTAGSGSEATRYAVVYHNGMKQSVTSEQIIPDAVMFDCRFLMTLPIYHRRATLFDALCHAIESFWSVNSTDESRMYAADAIRLITRYFDDYIVTDNIDTEPASAIQQAAYLAGQAINITQTTAGHALAYKITGTYGCAHGHAVALVMRILIPWISEHADRCIDSRGCEYFSLMLDELAEIFGCSNRNDLGNRFEDMFAAAEFEVPAATEEEILMLTDTVNVDRLRNFPIELTKDDVDGIYRRVLSGLPV